MEACRKKCNHSIERYVTHQLVLFQAVHPVLTDYPATIPRAPRTASARHHQSTEPLHTATRCHHGQPTARQCQRRTTLYLLRQPARRPSTWQSPDRRRRTSANLASTRSLTWRRRSVPRVYWRCSHRRLTRTTHAVSSTLYPTPTSTPPSKQGHSLVHSSLSTTPTPVFPCTVRLPSPASPCPVRWCTLTAYRRTTLGRPTYFRHFLTRYFILFIFLRQCLFFFSQDNP